MVAELRKDAGRFSREPQQKSSLRELTPRAQFGRRNVQVELLAVDHRTSRSKIITSGHVTDVGRDGAIKTDISFEFLSPGLNWSLLRAKFTASGLDETVDVPLIARHPVAWGRRPHDFFVEPKSRVQPFCTDNQDGTLEFTVNNGFAIIALRLWRLFPGIVLANRLPVVVEK